MKQISSMDLYFLTKELQILENQRIDNFYFEDDTFYLKIYIKTLGNIFLTNKVSKYIYIGNKKTDGSFPPNFIIFLRKHLKNGYIREIKQIEGERILTFKIDKKNQDEKIESFYLIMELFANGNIIICDENFNIKNSLYKKKFKDRALMVNNVYELPPQKKLNIHNINTKILREEISTSDLNLVKFLAIKFGMGGKYAEEVCNLSNIDKNKEIIKLDTKEIQNICKTLSDIKNKKITAYQVYKDNKIYDFLPFKFNSINLEQKKKSNFNETIKNYYKQFQIKKDKYEENLHKELERLQHRLETQKEQKKQILQDYEKYKEIGEKIYKNYSTIDDLLKSINKAGKEKGWEDVQQTIKNNPQLSKLIAKLDYKNNEIVINL
ncbi:MAG: NFACT family protein [Nanoarchaeota archaeon]